MFGGSCLALWSPSWGWKWVWFLCFSSVCNMCAIRSSLFALPAGVIDMLCSVIVSLILDIFLLFYL